MDGTHSLCSRRTGLSSSLLASLAIVACGGGGGDASQGPPLSSSSPLYAAPRAASAPVVTGDGAADAFNTTNHIRARLGLNTLVRSGPLDQSAQRHSTYFVQNGRSGPGAAGFHNEVSGLSGFTGVTVTDRARAAGYLGSPVQENMSIGSNSGVGSASGLTAVPYHRINMLGCYADIGVAEVNQVYTLDFGGASSSCGPSPDQLVAYPFPDQDDVPIGTFSEETPNPLPDIQPRQVGYPITLFGLPGSSLTLDRLTLLDGSGNNIPGRIVSTNTETGAPLGNYAFFMPLPTSTTGMFEWNTTYTAKAEGRFNGAPFSITWSFKTARL